VSAVAFRGRGTARRASVALSVLSLVVAGVASADGPAPPIRVAAFSGVQLLTRARWSEVGYGSEQATINAVVPGGAGDAQQVVDLAAPMDQALTFRVTGAGTGCRLVMAVYDGGARGAWNGYPTEAWAFTAPSFPFDYTTTASTFFTGDPQGGYGVRTRKVRVSPSSHQPRGQMCSGGSVDTTITFIATGSGRWDRQPQLRRPGRPGRRHAALPGHHPARHLRAGRRHAVDLGAPRTRHGPRPAVRVEQHFRLPDPLNDTRRRPRCARLPQQ
jgi:hypothetical protein